MLTRKPWYQLHSLGAATVNRVVGGRGAMALADQMMISGANFAANIVLVRGLGLSDFGKYYIAYALLLYANALQMSFVASPMLSMAPLMEGKEKRRFVEGMLSVQVLASLALFVVFAIAGIVAHAFTTFYSLSCVLAFSCCAGTFQLQDWLRRYYFLYGKGRLAIVNDFISYVVQLAALCMLWQAGGLTLSRTFLVMCVTSIAAVAMGPITDQLRPAFGLLRETWGTCRKLSRDLVVASQVRWFGTQGILLIGTGIVGTAGIGGVRATQAMAGPVNLVLNSLDNVLPMRIAEELKRKGTAGAQKFTHNAIVRSAALFVIVLVPVAVLGKPILRFLYGPAVEQFYAPMLLQLVSIIAAVAQRLWFHFFRSVQDTRPIMAANALCAVVNIATVYFLGHLWKAPGIVLSSLLGQAVIILYSMLHWRRHREELLERFPAPRSSKDAGKGACSEQPMYSGAVAQ